MDELFYNCISLQSLDLSNFITSNVTNMNKMFYNCNSLIKLNLSNFITSQVEILNICFIIAVLCYH